MAIRFAPLRSWLPVLIWMAVIYVGSTDLLSSRQTSRFIGPVLRWFKPDVSDQTIRRVQMVVRKSGHIIEYAILAMLCWRAVTMTQLEARPVWSWRRAVGVFTVATIYAMSDELHQSFVSSRMGSGWDVLIDACGAVIGLILIWTWGRLRAYW